MTYGQWVSDAYATLDASVERVGQHLFNHLCGVRSDITDALRATDVDPFYRDDLTESFLAAVADRW